MEANMWILWWKWCSMNTKKNVFIVFWGKITLLVNSELFNCFFNNMKGDNIFHCLCKGWSKLHTKWLENVLVYWRRNRENKTLSVHIKPNVAGMWDKGIQCLCHCGVCFRVWKLFCLPNLLHWGPHPKPNYTICST